jgi:hypothetical protein
MKQKLFLLVMLMGLSCFIAAQKDQPQRIQPADISKPVSGRISYSAKGGDSLRVEIVNINIPGLDIISCTNCAVDAPWTKAGGGQLEVVVKNQGLVKSKPATVWVSYYATKAHWGWGGASYYIEYIKDQKPIAPLDPGKTYKVQFFIDFGINYTANKKMGGVYLTENGTKPTRVRAAN